MSLGSISEYSSTTHTIIEITIFLKWLTRDLEENIHFVPGNNIEEPSRALQRKTVQLYDGICHQLHQRQICSCSTAASNQLPKA